MERTYVKPLQTMLEVFESLPEGTPAQLINNQIVMSPASSDPHQDLVLEISTELNPFVKKNQLGKVRIAPYDVYLNRHNVYQPDILFVANENLHKIELNGLHGAPDLVIEVLSPSSWHYDKGEKKDVYERSGVKELWLVDPMTKETEGLWLVNGEYEPLPSEVGKICFHSFNYTFEF